MYLEVEDTQQNPKEKHQFRFQKLEEDEISLFRIDG